VTGTAQNANLTLQTPEINQIPAAKAPKAGPASAQRRQIVCSLQEKAFLNPGMLIAFLKDLQIFLA